MIQDAEAQGLFDDLPVFPVSLPEDELRLLADIAGCEWPTNREIPQDQHATARRLAEKGLIKISRQKMDRDASWPTWFIGKMPNAQIREARD